MVGHPARLTHNKYPIYIPPTQAHQIFRQGLASGRPQGGVWERAAFLLEWEASLPSTHRPDAAWLRGVALEEKAGGEDRVRYLPADAMPLDPVERLRRLFDARKKWALEDMAPYLRCVDIAVGRMSLDFNLVCARIPPPKWRLNGRFRQHQTRCYESRTSTEAQQSTPPKINNTQRAAPGREGYGRLFDEAYARGLGRQRGANLLGQVMDGGMD